MKKAPFTVQEVERTVKFADDGSENYTDEDDPGAITDADFRTALDAVNGGCWDYIDERGDGTIILYPADSSMNYRTGAYESTTLIVKARRPEWADRLMTFYRKEK